MDIRDICHKIIDNPLETGWLDQNELAVFLQELTLFYSAQPNIARFRGKALFVGDIHGDIDSMLAAFKIADQESANIAFLGDIVDRGSHNVECVNLLISREYVEPGRIFYIRGNHEFRGINSKWGFMESVLARYPESVYDLYNEMFKQLPVAALQNNKVFGVHGGLSRHEDTIVEMDASGGDIWTKMKTRGLDLDGRARCIGARKLRPWTTGTAPSGMSSWTCCGMTLQQNPRADLK